MIISMFEILCVTNRRLCPEDFLTRVNKIAAAHPAGIILREKDLPEAEYQALAAAVLEICKASSTRCMLHQFAGVAVRLNAPALHLPVYQLRNLPAGERAMFSALGASCHSVEEAVEAESLGCTYITAGHIFNTDCKRGLPGRGLDFLAQVCAHVSIPVYAIGGITPQRIAAVKQAGAAGACVMSSIMTSGDPGGYLSSLKEG